MSSNEVLTTPLQQETLAKNIRIETVVASEWALQDEISEFADQRLREFGGMALLLDRMSSPTRRLWKASEITLDASVIPIPFVNDDAHVILSATRKTPSGRLANTGVLTVVGRRVRGSPLWVEAIGASSELAYTANAIAARREYLGKKTFQSK